MIWRILIILFLISSVLIAQNFAVKDVTDNIFILEDSESRESQAVIKTDKGLVVLNSFMSETTAERFRHAISDALDCNDFTYIINTTDRFDKFGGNAAYPGATVIGHHTFREKYKGHEQAVANEIRDLIEMWRWKEDVSRQRLETFAEGSDEAIKEARWMNTCKHRADEMESGYSLVLPDIYYNDRLSVDLGNISLELIWFGKAGHYDGMTVLVIPEEKTAIIPNFIMHPQHLAPYPYHKYAELDVPRWIAVLEEILEGEDAVEKVVCGINEVWPKERAHRYLYYIRKLWNCVKSAEKKGKSFTQIQEQYSLNQEFAFIKEMSGYLQGGDEWFEPQHNMHM